MYGTPGCHSCGPAVVALYATYGDDAVMPCLLGICQQKLQLADLHRAHSQTQQIGDQGDAPDKTHAATDDRSLPVPRLCHSHVTTNQQDVQSSIGCRQKTRAYWVPVHASLQRLARLGHEVVMHSAILALLQQAGSRTMHMRC